MALARTTTCCGPRCPPQHWGEVGGARDILPFVLMSYGQPSRYAWADEDDTRSWINQAEGGEQGDPLMPLLFSLGITGALATVQEQLGEGEFLFAFLDDVYAVCAPERVGEVYMALEKALREHAVAHSSTRAKRKCGTRQGCNRKLFEAANTAWALAQGLA